jgi:hypothetical protein
MSTVKVDGDPKRNGHALVSINRRRFSTNADHAEKIQHDGITSSGKLHRATAFYLNWVMIIF